MPNFYGELLVTDLEGDSKPIGSHLVAASNTSAATLLGTWATFVDGRIDGKITAANLRRKIRVPLPANLKSSAVAGSRIQEKVKLTFRTDSDNPDKSRVISVPAILSTMLEPNSNVATNAFITSAEAAFINASTPFFCDNSFNHFTSLESASEAYSHKLTGRD